MSVEADLRQLITCDCIRCYRGHGHTVLRAPGLGGRGTEVSLYDDPVRKSHSVMLWAGEDG